MYEFEMRNVQHEAQGGEESQGFPLPYLAMAHGLVPDVESLPVRIVSKEKIKTGNLLLSKTNRVLEQCPVSLF